METRRICPKCRKRFSRDEVVCEDCGEQLIDAASDFEASFSMVKEPVLLSNGHDVDTVYLEEALKAANVPYYVEAATACLSAACRNSASAAACSTCWAAASSGGRTAAPSAATAGRFWKAPSTPERICNNKQDLPERNQAGLACYFASLESIVPRKTTKRS